MGVRPKSEMDRFWVLWAIQSYGYYNRKGDCPCRIPQFPPML